MPNKNDNMETIKKLTAGSFAGTTEAVITWPTENIKTQMQFKGQNLSFLETTKKIYNQQGFSGFYRGMSPILIFNIPKVASRFYSYDVMSGILENKINKNTNMILSGLFAGFVESTFITVPSETIKTKFIKHPHLGIFDIIKMEGAKGLYQGYTPTLGRQCLNQASRFFFYEHYKQMILKKNKKFTNIDSFMGGVGAGCFSVAISTPMDVLKTQMQEGGNIKMTKLAKDVYLKNGIFGFWRGSIARLLRVAPGQGVMFLTYDFTTQIIDQFLKK